MRKYFKIWYKSSLFLVFNYGYNSDLISIKSLIKIIESGRTCSWLRIMINDYTILKSLLNLGY